MDVRVTGTLYIVSTSIGASDEITPRAISTLKNSELVLAEDTRRAGILLSQLGVGKKPLLSYHDYNERDRVGEIINKLRSGMTISLISDAGTPLISDPGYHLVRACHDAGIKVSPVSGSSSITAALSVSGLPTDRFIFEGFLPHGGGKRKKRLKKALTENSTVVIFESTHRIEKLISEIAELEADRFVVICRELTKTYEEVLRGKATEILSIIRERGGLKGEIVVLLAGQEKIKPEKRNKYKDVKKEEE